MGELSTDVQALDDVVTDLTTITEDTQDRQPIGCVRLGSLLDMTGSVVLANRLVSANSSIEEIRASAMGKLGLL